MMMEHSKQEQKLPIVEVAVLTEAGDSGGDGPMNITMNKGLPPVRTC
jgi:hypothetical protein